MAKTTLTYSDWRTYAALLIFVFVWLLIAQVPLPRVLRRIGLDSFGRTPATVLGACTIVALGIVSPEEAFASQRPETLLLLAGLMIILGKFEEKGFMEACQRRLLRGKNLTPLKLLVRLSILSGLLAAFLMNDGAALFLSHIVASIAEKGRLDMAPLALAVATSANVGSSMLIIGNPKSMLIAEFDSSMTFVSYLERMIVPSLLALALNTALLYFFYRSTFQDVKIKHLKALQLADKATSDSRSDESLDLSDDDEVQDWMGGEDEGEEGGEGEGEDDGKTASNSAIFHPDESDAEDNEDGKSNTRTPLLRNPFRADEKQDTVTATAFSDDKNLWVASTLPDKIRTFDRAPVKSMKQFRLKPLSLVERVFKHCETERPPPASNEAIQICLFSPDDGHDEQRTKDEKVQPSSTSYNTFQKPTAQSDTSSVHSGRVAPSTTTRGGRALWFRMSNDAFTKLSNVVFIVLLLGMYVAFTLRFDLSFSCLLSVVLMLFADHLIMSAKSRYGVSRRRRQDAGDANADDDDRADANEDEEDDEDESSATNSTAFIVDSVNWGLLIYLFGIFIVIQGVQNTPIPDDITRVLKVLANWQPLAHAGSASAGDVEGWQLRVQLLIIACVFSILVMGLSLVFTSIPVVLLVAPALQTLAKDHSASSTTSSSSSSAALFVSISWYLLAWSTSLCGNITPFGSVAGLIVSEICKPDTTAKEGDKERGERSDQPSQRWVGELSVWIRFAGWSTVLLLLLGSSFLTVFAK